MAIFAIEPEQGVEETLSQEFLCYVQRYDIVNQINPEYGIGMGRYPDPATGCYMVKPGFRAHGHPMGDIIPLCQLQQMIGLVPHFGEEADKRFKKSNILDLPDTTYYVNKYFTRNLFYSLHLWDVL